MSLFTSTTRSGMAGLRSTPSATTLLRRSFTPMASSVSAAPRVHHQQQQQQMSIAQQRQDAPSASASMATAMMVRPFMHSARVSAPATTKLSPDDALRMLNEQRSLRPSSPHFTIYQPQATWYLSILTRMTGVGLSAVLYVWAIGYFALPFTGVGQVLSSAHLVQYAAMAPVWLKVAIKAPLAFAFSFHSFNGVRHLLWDWGIGLSMKGVYVGAYAVLAASVAATVGLCLL